MNLADRIQALRKTRGISQEALADILGVSRQAVSKWESGQSNPELDNVAALCDYFGVTADYLLRGIEPPAPAGSSEHSIGGKILLIASVAFVAIGLLCGLGGWYADQRLEDVAGAMMVQAVGMAAFFIGRVLTGERPSTLIWMLNLAGILFMPVSMAGGALAHALLRTGWIAPYPVTPYDKAVFLVLYPAVLLIAFLLLRRRIKHSA